MLKTAEIIETSTGQVVRLPDEFRFDAGTVSIRRAGDAVILEPAKANHWPPGFFDQIHVSDPAFTRPDQGTMPPVANL